MIRGFQIPILLVGTCIGFTGVARVSGAVPAAALEPARGNEAVPLQAAAPGVSTDAPPSPAAPPTDPAIPAPPAATDAPPAATDAPPAATDAPPAATDAPPAATDAPPAPAPPVVAPPVPPASAAVPGELEYPGYVPGYRRVPGVGLSPFAPGTNPPIGGTTPSFGATIRPQQWNVDFHGNFLWYGGAGIGTNGNTGATAFHIPDRGNDGYFTPGTNASFGFTVSQGELVSSVDFNTGLDVYGFQLVYTPPVAPGWQLEVIFGDTGAGFGGPVGVGGRGIRTRTEWQADTYLGLVFEQGLLYSTKDDRGSASLGQFYSLQADYDGVYQGTIAFVTQRLQDAEPVKQAGAPPFLLNRSWGPDQQLNQGALGLVWFGEDLGQVNLGLQYSRSLDEKDLGPGANGRGGANNAFFTDAMGINKAALSAQLGYSLSIFRFIDPGFYDPDGRDLKAGINFSYVKPIDPLPLVDKFGDFYDVGLNVSYRIFGGTRVWVDYGLHDPSVKLENNQINTQKFSGVAATIEFKSAPLSPEYFQLSWAHDFHAKNYTPAVKNPGDTEKFGFRAGMFW